MPMSKSQPMTSKEEIVASLMARATELWGPERASNLLRAIEQTADEIWRISQDLPAADEEPGFYF